MTKLFRVTLEETSSWQGHNAATYWQRSALYCGPDADKARAIYHESKPRDFWGQPGNPCRSTGWEHIETDDLGDDDPGRFPSD